MQVTFWGTRGSIAKAGPSTLRYGGNTSCVEVRSDGGTLIVLDCGTGAHGLGGDLMVRSNGGPLDGHILIGHTHWDHIQGLPFFAPLFGAENNWRIYGPRGLGTSLNEILAGQMQYSYFPVNIEQLAAAVSYHDLVEGCFEIDDVRVTTQYLNHPALTLGYRLEVDGATVVYASDHEPHRRELAAGGDLDTSRHDSAHARFLEGADLLIHDAQYLASEYESKVGWGHSTVEYVMAAASRAGVGRVALFHHDPTRDDDAVDSVVELARARGGASGFEGDVFAAAEGMQIDLHGEPSPAEDTDPGAMVATLKPALDEIRRTVLLAVPKPDVAATLREAAAAESLEIREATERERSLEIVGTDPPALVFFDADADADADDEGDGLDFARAVRDLDRRSDREVGLIAVTRTGPRPPTDEELTITDWLVWPFSEVYVRTKLHAWLMRRACRWQNAALPPDEDRRLRSLRALEILDTDPESRFDRFTALASSTLDVPIALISLVDANRQWFKSRHGIEVTETPRDMSICAHAILDEEVLQVPDTLQDPRFADNPVVAGDPRLRFYAGVPLELSDGSRAGTLCVVDYRPRLLDEAQLAELRRLGDLVSRELETG